MGMVIIFFSLYKILPSPEFLKHSANLLTQQLSPILQSITTLLQERKILFNIETCK